MAEETFIKKPCQHCPFRKDVKPFLHPARGEELACLAQNPFSSFPCHKTTEHDDDGELVNRPANKECAGFLTLKAAELGEDEVPDGFTPSFDLVYCESWDMASAYEEGGV